MKTIKCLIKGDTMKKPILTIMAISILVVIAYSVLYSLDGKESKMPKAALPLNKVETANAQIKANHWFGGVDKYGIPTMLEGNLFSGQKGGDRVADSYTFFEQNKELFQMPNPKTELLLEGEIKDQIEETVIFNQVSNGVRVRYGQYVMHYNPNGVLETVNGQIDAEARKINTNPAISEEQAKSIAIQDMEKVKVDWPENAQTEIKNATLTIARFDGELKLAWGLSVIKGVEGYGYWIDAQTGKIIESGSSKI
jgi:Zn-dependent metalloprotease